MTNIYSNETATRIQTIYENIYTKKPRYFDKDSAFIRIIERLSEDDFEELKLVISHLYSTFVPPLPKETTTENVWNKILPALAKNVSERKLLSNLYSDGNNLVGTNGHFMVIQKNKKLPQGYYGKDLTPLPNINQTYVDYNRVWDMSKRNQKELISPTVVTYRAECSPKHLYTQLGDVWVDYKSFNLIAPKDTKWYIGGLNQEMLRGIHKDFEFLLMILNPPIGPDELIKIA